jgi:C-terminal processing protease CtpA/Prc
MEALESSMSALASAKGIIFDMRGYPADAAYELMQHLIDEPATSAKWNVPIVRKPDGDGWEWNESGRWQLAPKAPRLMGKVAFLTDGRAISYAESIMGIVEAYKFGEIVGSTTAGTNGNINPFALPGGYTVSWTGMRVLKHDGSRHHGVGIAPTTPVTPTAQGVADGTDEVLLKAIEVIGKQITEAK